MAHDDHLSGGEDKPSTLRQTGSLPSALLYLLPFLAISIAGLIAQDRPDAAFDHGDFRTAYGRSIATAYVVQAVVMTIAIAFGWRRVTRSLPIRFSWLGFVVGAVGVAVWVGLCSLQLEDRLFGLLGLQAWIPERIGFDPFRYLESQVGWMATFFVARFAVLALLVPVAEEWLVRGLAIRWHDDPDDWESRSLEQTSSNALRLVLVYAVLTHPQEFIAAIAWFAMINWLMKKTGSIWDCIIAHGTTNALLGAYVLYTQDWRLW
jgi:CAAX prenyl protease-like protein